MTDMKEAMREAQAHATRVTRAKRDRDKQIAAAVVRANDACNRKVDASLKALSPAAARIVVAAELEDSEVVESEPYDEIHGGAGLPGFGVDPKDSERLLELRCAIDDFIPWPSEASREAGDYVAALKHAGNLLTVTADPNPAPDWMNREPPPLAPGSLIAVDDKPKVRRA